MIQLPLCSGGLQSTIHHLPPPAGSSPTTPLLHHPTTSLPPRLTSPKFPTVPQIHSNAVQKCPKTSGRPFRSAFLVQRSAFPIDRVPPPPSFRTPTAFHVHH